MKYLLFLAFLLVGCPINIDPRLELGQCYHQYGDVGGTPRYLNCVHAIGETGFLNCQGSSFRGKWEWYACGDAERWSWLDNNLRIVKCPKPCVETGDKK